MNARAAVFCIALASLTAGCPADPPKDAPKPESPAPASNVTRYGAPIGAGDTLKLASVLAEPDKYKNQPVIVEAEVRKACTKKGCWMELAESLDKTAQGCRVTFKDYGFFVPIDSAGSHARVQGTVTSELVAASYVKHLEEEGAHFPKKNPDGTADEVRFVATGVELSKKP
jgi:hypothetical protein